MVNKNLSYYALVDREIALGVTKKIDNTVIASNIIGIKASGCFFNTNFKGVLNFLSNLISDKAEIIVIRFSDLVFPVVFFIMIYLRLKGKKIVVDVPTPRVVGLIEIDVLIKNPIIRSLRKCISYISSSWVLFPASLIVQYADEGTWFKLGVSKKTIKMGNGILVNNQSKLRCSLWPSKELKLVAVANVSNWHGYDRLLKAIAAIEQSPLSFKVRFSVVGEGDGLSYLKKLTHDLNISSNVNFLGMKSGKELETILINSDIGVSSLGLYRKGLNEASDLKTREYMIHGLPVIGVGTDPDFSNACSFRYTVSNDDNIDSIISLIKSFEEMKLTSPEVIRDFAKKHLSLEAKVERIFNCIL